MSYEIHHVDEAPWRLLRHIDDTGEAAVDTETTGLHWALGHTAFMAQFAPDEENAYWTCDPALALQVLLHMEGVNADFVFHNATFDFHALRTWCGWYPKNGYRNLPFADVMHAFRIQYPGESASLKQASKRYCKDMDVDGPEKAVKAWRESVAWSKIAGKRVKRDVPYNEVPLDLMVPYATQDVILTLRSHHALKQERELWSPPVRERNGETFELNVPSIGHVYDEEIKTVATVTEMERAGMSVDVVELNRQTAVAQMMVAQFERQWSASEFAKWNNASPKALQGLFYTECGERVKHRTKPTKTQPKGSPSLDETALRDMDTERGRAAASILLPLRNWRMALKNLERIDHFTTSDRRIHTSLKGDRARTGRFSSADPPLQNTPRPKAENPWTMVRGVFGPAPGKEWLLADFSQIELRVAAHYMKDMEMTRLLNTGQDLHAATAAKMYGIAIGDVTKRMRDLAKILNFSLLYGAGRMQVIKTLRYGQAGTEPLTEAEAVEALEQLGGGDGGGNVYKELAEALIEAVHRAMPGARKFLDDAGEAAKKHGGVYTKYGLWIPVAQPRWSDVYGKMVSFYHKSGNAIVQGSAAGLMKATLNLEADLLEQFSAAESLHAWSDVALFMSIHDESIFEVPVGYAEKLAHFIDPHVSSLNLFQPVEIKMEYAIVRDGKSWADKEKYEWR